MKKFLSRIELRTPGWDAITKLRKSQTDHPEILRPSTFAQLPIFLAIAAVLVVYAVIASKNREALAWIDQFVTPAVDSLRFFGLGITQPMMVGPMPQRFYTNLVGLGVWGVLAYAARTIVYAISHRELPAFPDSAERLWMINKGCGRLRAWLGLRLTWLFGIIPIMLVFSVSLLNGINGWWVIHVLEFTAPPGLMLIFVVGPGAAVSALALACLAYVVYDIKLFLRLFQRI